MKSLIVLALSITISLVLAQRDYDFSTNSRFFSELVYHELITWHEDNLVVSPFSAETILAMAQSGAPGHTGREIRSSLRLPETEAETEDVFKEFIPTLASEDFVVKAACKIFVPKDAEIDEDFKGVVTDTYGGEVGNIDFGDEDADEIINDWVEKETKGLIKDIVSDDDFDERQSVVLIDALYFQASWLIPFDPEQTDKRTFQTGGRKRIETDFMTIESAEINYYHSVDLQAKFIELPFKGTNATMTFILPDSQDGFYDLERHPIRVFENQRFTKQNVQIFLPKFRIESTTNFRRVLRELGVSAAFEPREADFSEIYGKPGDLYISRITQKAYIDVNEIGVHVPPAKSIEKPEEEPKPAARHFIADRPFMYQVKVNDIILFEGRVMEPRYEEEEESDEN